MIPYHVRLKPALHKTNNPDGLKRPSLQETRYTKLKLSLLTQQHWNSWKLLQAIELEISSILMMIHNH